MHLEYTSEYVLQPEIKVTLYQLEGWSLLPPAQSQYWPTKGSSPSSCHSMPVAALASQLPWFGKHKVAVGFAAHISCFLSPVGKRAKYKPSARQNFPTRHQPKAANPGGFWVSYYIWESSYTGLCSHLTSSCSMFTQADFCPSYTLSSCDVRAIYSSTLPFLHLDCYCL